jgi:RNA polymerase sigma-70 factor, ECF subfamily
VQPGVDPGTSGATGRRPSHYDARREATTRSRSNTSTSEADRGLAARLLAGDLAALATAYDEYGALVHAVAHGVLRDPSMAEEVTQEAFTYLWTNPDRFDPSRGSLRAWVNLLAHRRSVDRVRREQRRTETESRIDADRVADGDIEDHVTTQWVCQRVRRALQTLPPEQREVLVRAYYGGRTYREVAMDLSLPEGTVKSRVRLALRHLNEQLRTEFAAEDVRAWT